MTLLLLGLILYAGAHLLKTAAPSVRAGMAAKVGDTAVKGSVAVLLVASVFLMVRGYGAAPADVVWVAPDFMRAVVVMLMLPALILFFGSYPGSALRARIRHPQLTGFKLWAGLHLLMNGEVRAIVLFGGLLAWAVLSVIFLKRRDGKPPLPAASDSVLKAWLCVPIGFVAWVGIMWAHGAVFGVYPFG